MDSDDEDTGLIALARGAHRAPTAARNATQKKSAQRSDSSDDDEAPSSAKASKFQVSLDDEKNVRELEDADLVRHMADARNGLADHEKKHKELPEEKEVAKKYAETLKSLSSCLASVSDSSKSAQVQIECLHLESSNAMKLATGERPHGYPDVKPKAPKNADALRRLGAMIKTAAENGERQQKNFAALKKELTLIRRNLEFVVDSQNKMIQRLKEADS